jgi:hypothetical protein
VLSNPQLELRATARTYCGVIPVDDFPVASVLETGITIRWDKEARLGSGRSIEFFWIFTIPPISAVWCETGLFQQPRDLSPIVENTEVTLRKPC